jgi:hypothetical protein
MTTTSHSHKHLTDKGGHVTLAHLDGMDGLINGDLQDLLASTDRLHSDFSLEGEAVGAALAHWSESLSG